MSPGRFESDTAALERRLESHERFGARDLNEWIFGHLAAAAGQRILDLGCGTGKQSIPLAQTVGDDGVVVCLDVSAEALAKVTLRSRELGLDARIRAVHADLDEIADHLRGERFERILGSYCLYYARRPETLLGCLRETLVPGGVLFFCGPSRENNAELKRFHYALQGEAPPETTAGAGFMEGEGQRLTREIFDEVEVFAFENPLRFDSAESLHRYWSSYNLFEEELDEAFLAAADRHFRSHESFETVKRVVGVRAVTSPVTNAPI